MRKMRTFIHVLIILCIFFSPIMNLTAFGLGNGKTDDAGEGKGIHSKDIIYFIMTDRFNDGDPSNNYNANKKDIKTWHGGDLQGVIDKLDYIQGLGATAIWLTPVQSQDVGGYHGYWAVDFRGVDKHLGDMNKLKELVKKAHEKGIKVILDYVVNHTGVLHPWVRDEAYTGWFHEGGSISNWNDPKEVENLRLAGLPDLAQENPAVKNYLIDTAKWWISETEIDGFRLDTVRHVNKEFWIEFTSEIKKDYPDFYFIGEVWDGNPVTVGSYQKTGISGLVDFPMYYTINDLFAKSKKADLFISALAGAKNYENPTLMGTFIDNHDVSRFASAAGMLKTEKLKQATAFQMTYTGIPIIYYGTEIAMEGAEDPTNRGDMDFTKTSELQSWIKKLSDIRKTNPALTGGEIKILKAQEYNLAYLRSDGVNEIIPVFNISGKESTIKMNVAGNIKSGGNTLVNLLNEEEKIPIKKDGMLEIKLAPKDVKIYKVIYDESPIILVAIAGISGVVGFLIIFWTARKYRKNREEN